MNPAGAPQTDNRTPPLPDGALARLLVGLQAPLAGFLYLARRPHLLPLALAPAILNLTLLIVAVLLTVWVVPDLLDGIWPRPEPDGLGGILGLAAWRTAALMAMVTAILLAAVVVWAVANILATPFLDGLSERIERELAGGPPPDWADRPWIRRVAVSAGHSLLGLTVYLAVMPPLLALNLVPVAGQVMFLTLSWAASAGFLARELLDGPLTRRGCSFRAKLQFVARQKALFGGLGLATAVLLWIPLLNFLCLPVAVTGATVLFARLTETARTAEAVGQAPAGRPERASSVK